MTLSAWRIVRREFRATAFSGEGARLFPGRWNSAGTALVYTAGSRSLAILEMLVHLGSVERLPEYWLIEARFEPALVTFVDPAKLPRHWQRFPAPLSLRKIGDDWVRRQSSAALQVPSALTGEANYLLNPAHPDFRRLEIGKPQRLQLDARLVPQLPTSRGKRSR